MTLAYLVVPDALAALHGADEGALGNALTEARLRKRAAVEGFSVYAPVATPILHLPLGGLIIGRVYSGSTAIEDGTTLAAASHRAFRDRILQDFWGDYLLLLPEADGSGIVEATCGPSPGSDLRCYYAQEGDAPFLTSRLSLAQRLGLYRRRVDFGHLAHRLAYPDLKTARTGLAGIRELLPGCTLRLGDGDARVRADWNPWAFAERSGRRTDIQDAADALRHAALAVVRAWAKDDGPALLELSGGLDSSIVGACLAQAGARTACATLAASAPGSDESAYARPVAARMGAELVALELRHCDARYAFPLPPDIATPMLGPLQYAFDNAMRDAAEHADAGCHYSGVGGDSVFSYLTNAAPAADAFRTGGLKACVRTIHDLSMFHQCTYWTAGRLTLKKLLGRANATHAIDRSFLPKRAPLPEPELHPWLAAPAGALAGDRQRILELCASQFYRDTCPRALSRRMRRPLLSQPVVEACLKVPSWMWFAGGQNRTVARRAFSDLLPPTVVARKSKGTFTAFLGAFYRRELEGMISFLVDGQLEGNGLIDADALRKLAGREMPRDTDAFIRVFHLCCFENWARQ